MAIQTSASLQATEPGVIADVVEEVLPSVVSVASTRTAAARNPHGFFFGAPPAERKSQGLGSGVILTADGLVVTNNHVIEDADEVKVRTFDDREFDAEVVGTDPKSDVAVLQLKGELGELRPIRVGDSASLRLGEVVLAVGNPFGVGQTVTMGIVSAKGRADMGIVDYEDFIQTDAAINPGNSGGALVNTRGELVGINTAILSRSGGYMGIGFAIPTNMAVPIVEALRTDGKVTRGFLGVIIQDLTSSLQQAMELGDRDGVLIADVQADGPAAAAGLKSGDVVTEINGQAVDSTGRFRNVIASAGADQEVKLTIVREGQEKKITVKLGELPSSGDAPSGVGEAPDDGPAVDGLALRELTPELRQKLRIPEGLSGVVVAGVKPGSSAAESNLRPGDLIVEIDRKPVNDLESARKRYAKLQDAKLLRVYRGGTFRYVVVK